MNKNEMPEDPFVALEKKRKELVAKGFTGISVFVSKNNDCTANDRAKDMLKMLNALDGAKSMSGDEYFEKHLPLEYKNNKD